MTGQMMPDRPSRPFRIPKKIAMINDIAGYGRCSTTVSLPIISAMQVQVCPVPTSIFSNHTGFPVHFMHDCTDILPEYLEKWRELELTFDGIYCGFLGSVTQIGIVKDFLASQTGNAGHSRISADGNRPIVILDQMCIRDRTISSLRYAIPVSCANEAQLISFLLMISSKNCIILLFIIHTLRLNYSFTSSLYD